MGFAAGGCEDVLDLDPAGGQGVGDQRAVASPGDGFRAHDQRGRAGGEFDETGKSLAEGRGLHVIGIAAKAGVLPAGVDGILAGVAESPEPRQMDVLDATLVQRIGELILAELRIAARFGDGADVDEPPDAVRLEHFEELLDGERGVSDGEDHTGCSKVLSFESTSSTTGPGSEKIIVALRPRQSRLFS